MTQRISVLLIEDDEDDYILAQELLAAIDEPEHALTWARTFDEGLQRLLDEQYDVCLLDYALGERTGMDLLSRAHTAGVEVPIIFLTGQSERALDVEATQQGAADYLVKGRINADLLERSIRYAIERGRSLSTLSRLNRELERSRIQGIRANQARNKFLVAVSHACHEALDTILGHCEAMQQRLQALDDSVESDIRGVREAGRRLRELLASIVETSTRKPEAPTMEFREIELHSFVREISAAILPLAGHNGNTFESICADDVGSIETDPHQLRRVLLNLLGNACKFARRGRILLEVSRRTARRDNIVPGGSGTPPDQVEIVEFALRASGLWMSPAQIELTFSWLPESGVGDVSMNSGDESGIALCRHVCHLLGGELFVEAEGPRRPTLRVCLPVRGRA